MRLPFTYLALVLALPLACGPGTGTSDASSSSSGPGPGPGTDSGTGGPTTGTPTASDPTAVTTIDSSTDATTSGDPTFTSGEPPTSTTFEPGTTSLETTTGAIPGAIECTVDADCKLNQDCCTCDAIPVGDEFFGCEENCRQPMCDALGIDEAVCNLGVCEPARLSCDASAIACEEGPPPCEAGTVPETTPACWTGRCVPAALCDVVPDCALCPAETMCVQKVAFTVESSCQPIPPACAGEVACECVAELVCTDNFGLCSVAGPVVQCTCPNC